MRTWEFVITGGPCAGKSTGLSIVEQMLTKKGYKVIVVPETATEVISSGIVPSELSTKQFQALIMDRSINKEVTTRTAAAYMKRDTVILYDRGLLDSKAYMPYEMFIDLLNDRGLNEVEVRDRYDAVFHLVTAADGAEQYYTLENNQARSESPEQARELDKKTRDAWVGHSHLRVIDNSTGFKEKIDRLINEILSVMGLPIPIENERKFLVVRPSEEILKELKAVQLSICQSYLGSEEPEVERRIRQRGDGQNFSYYYTEKRKIEGSKRFEVERRISQKEYLSLLMDAEKSVRKYRYCFLHSNVYFELDIFPDWKEEALVEIEVLDEKQEINFPEWISVIREVTSSAQYYNINLAK